MLQLGQIDRGDDKPPYRQIANMLRDAISSGQLAAEERLPSEAELIQHFGVARMTARQAIQLLRIEGLVASQHGRGVFVRPVQPIRQLTSDRLAPEQLVAGESAFSYDAAKAGYKPEVDSTAVARAKPTTLVAERLRLSSRDEVVARSRRHLADGRPVEIAVSYIPAAFASGTRVEEVGASPSEIYESLAKVGHKAARFTEEVHARRPISEERRQLALDPGVCVLTVVRTAYDVNNMPFEVLSSVKDASVWTLEYEFPSR